jgi:hypothetical protein
MFGWYFIGQIWFVHMLLLVCQILIQLFDDIYSPNFEVCVREKVSLSTTAPLSKMYINYLLHKKRKIGVTYPYVQRFFLWPILTKCWHFSFHLVHCFQFDLFYMRKRYAYNNICQRKIFMNSNH